MVDKILIVKRGLQGRKGDTGNAAPQTIIVANNMESVIAVADSIDNVNTVAGSIDNVNTVAGSIDNVNTVADNITEVRNVSDNMEVITEAVAAAALVGTLTLGNSNKYLMHSTPASAPGEGNLSFNLEADPEATTSIWISYRTNDEGNPNISQYIDTWDDSTDDVHGTLTIRDTNNIFNIFNITGSVTFDGDDLSYTLPVTYVDGNGVLTDGSDLVVTFARTGDKGDTGLSGSVYAGTSGGAANAQTLTFGSVASYTAGDTYLFKAGFTNTTTSPTIDVNGIGPITLTKKGTRTTFPADIIAGYIYQITYDPIGPYFQVTGPVIQQGIADLISGGTSGGSANAQTMTCNGINNYYSIGDMFEFIAGATNSASCTMNVNAIGAKTIKKWGNTNLYSGDIVIGSYYILQYDGTNLQLLNPTTAVNRPAFSAYKSGPAQTINGTVTAKVTFQTENFDTDGCFASSTFTPNLAGYYNFNVNIDSKNMSRIYVALYKNGVQLNFAYIDTDGGAFASSAPINASFDMIQANGTTDFFEIFVTAVSGFSNLTVQNTTNTYFTGYKVNI